MQNKPKPCKGINKAKDFNGCGKVVNVRTYGLCPHCLYEWSQSTEEGALFIESRTIKTQKALRKEEKTATTNRMKKMDISVNGKTKYKNYLRDEVNKLARMIDNYFGYNCIDCGKPYGEQQDGGHFKAVKGNENLRFNLHNIHSQKSDCNRNGLGGGRLLDYYDGLGARYSKEYAYYIRYEMGLIYPVLKPSSQEIYDKLVLVRELIRIFDSFVFTDGIQAREQLNQLIGFYTVPYIREKK